MTDFGFLAGIRTFELHLRLDLLRKGDKLTAESDGYHVTKGSVYQVIEVDGKLCITNDELGDHYTKTSPIRYQRHAKGPNPHFGGFDVKVEDEE